MRKALRLVAILAAFGLTVWIGVVALAQGSSTPTPSTSTTTSPAATADEDIKGNCDEAEHANDPECVGVNPVAEDDHENDDQGDVNDDDQGENEDNDQGENEDNDDQGENEDNDDQGENEDNDDQGENEDNDDQGGDDQATTPAPVARTRVPAAQAPVAEASPKTLDGGRARRVRPSFVLGSGP